MGIASSPGRADEGRHPVERLAADYVERRRRGETTSIEDYAGAHPALADDIRAFFPAVEYMENALPSPPSAGQQERSDFASEVLQRLAGRGKGYERYEPRGEVGRGGQGKVLRVWDEDLHRTVAMKVLPGARGPESGDAADELDPPSLGRFLEEAQVTGQLDHPGIVPVHELGLEAEGCVYFTMKLVKGRDLKTVFDLVREGREGWTQTRALNVMLKVCEAMAYAHSKGVIHRDLKPGNVMVGEYGEVYVMDWGLAKVQDHADDKDIRLRPSEDDGAVTSERSQSAEDTPDSPLQTMDGDVIGTPVYMPPEQARGDLAAMGPHSDVYAVGAMLYHLLAGHMPYVQPGETLSSRVIWERVKEGAPHSLEKDASDASAELVAICERAMARDVAGRYPEMSALSEDLSAYLEGRVVRAYQTGAWAETRKWVQRNKPLAASLAAVVLAIAVGGLAFAVKADEATKAAALARRNEREAKDNLTVAQRAQAEEKAQRDLAQRNEAEARKQQLRAEAETAKVLRLSDVKVLQELEDEADDLWPAHPDEIADLESWRVRARELADRLPGHRETLAEMRSRAQPWSDEERKRDRETHPRAGELDEKRAEFDGLIAQLDSGLVGDEMVAAEERLAELEPEVLAMTNEVNSRRKWSFETAEDQWQHDVLAELIANVEGLEAGLLAENSIPESHGWSVPRRLALAKDLKAGFAEGGEYANAWARALPAIREAYPDLGLEPQMGLVPIGPDPESGLWEFAHLMTGAPAERGEDDELILTEETGVVLVLLRDGSFWMGAQKDDPNGRNYDRLAAFVEQPVHEVELSPFFLSKYEMTQGQWERMSGKNPSFFRDGVPSSTSPATWEAVTLLHPVETVSWADCMAWLPRVGLRLPSEAQWEYGARAGTDTPWWTGAERDSLMEKHAANLADGAAAQAGAAWLSIQDWPELDDGYTVYAPIGAYSANPFGLHEIHGNLNEWCLDGAEGDSYVNSPSKDPLAPWQDSSLRVFRGGSFSGIAERARSAARLINQLSRAANDVGVRPARAITE
jgi:formylglycine-generating enzyme required for sulfatase activity/serine/threonine protein kinase